MNYSESMSKRQQRRKALNQRFRRMFLVALLMGLAMGFVFGRCSAVNSKAPDAPIEPDQLIFVTLRSVKQSTGSLPLKSRLNSTMKTTFPKMLIWMGSWMLGPMTLLKSWKFLKKGCMSNGV